MFMHLSEARTNDFITLKSRMEYLYLLERFNSCEKEAFSEAVIQP